MKFYSTLALAALAIVSFSSGRASAAETDDTIFFEGTVQMSEITAVKEGVSKTYDVPAKLASQFSTTSAGEGASFGMRSRCAPFLGETPTELRHKVTGITAFKSIKTGDFSYEKQPVQVPATSTIVIPKGSRVFGTCGGDGKTLNELGIYPPKNEHIVFDEKP